MDLEEVEDATAALLAAATDVSASTRASYERRWRMWAAFADHHRIHALPAEPVHVAAFVVARHGAGVSPSGIAANLSAVGWFHGRLDAAPADVCGPARVVVRALARAGEPAVHPAPVLSVGRFWRWLAGLVGLPGSVSGYSLRRSWATHRYLEDPNALGRISLQLRHTSADVTVRYIDDLRLQTVHARALLSPDVVIAGPGGQPQRKDLGFTPAPLEEFVERAAALGNPAGRLSAKARRLYDSLWSIWARFATGHDLAVLPATPEGVALFIASRADAGLRPSYLRQQLSIIERFHNEAGQPVDGLGDLAREVLDAYARTATTSTRTAPLLSIDDLRAMARHARQAGGPEGLRSRGDGERGLRRSDAPRLLSACVDVRRVCGLKRGDHVAEPAVSAAR